MGALDLPTGRRGRLLALGLTFAVLGALWVAVAAPLIEWHALRAEQVQARRALARRMAEIAETLPELRDQARVAAASGRASGEATLDGASDAIAAATLQGRLQEMAARAGAPLTSAEALPGEAAGAWRRIGVRVVGERALAGRGAAAAGGRRRLAAHAGGRPATARAAAPAADRRPADGRGLHGVRLPRGGAAVSRAAFGALAVLAVALGGAIALQLPSVEGDEVAIGAAAAAVARWRPAPAVPTPPSPDRSREWAATALARPLFAPDRRPVPEPRAAVASGPGGREPPRLAGVLVTPAGGAAIFAAGEGAKPLVLRVGDKLNEFEVKAIVAGEVTLTGPEGDRVVRPTFDPRPGGGGSSAPRPQPPVAAAPRPPRPPGLVPAAASGGAPVQLPPSFPPGSPGR